MKRIIFTFAIVFLLLASEKASSQYYFGVGPVFKNPISDFSDLNKPVFGVNFQFESRQWCLLWFGLRVDYFSLQKADDLAVGADYYQSEFTISPGVRYNFLGKDCYKYNIVPYAQAMLRISSITGTDELDPMGLGVAAGIGVAFSFSFMNVCSMVDLNALYNSPNAILVDKKRDVIQSIDVALTLSVRL